MGKHKYAQEDVVKVVNFNKRLNGKIGVICGIQNLYRHPHYIIDIGLYSDELKGYGYAYTHVIVPEQCLKKYDAEQKTDN